MRLGFDICGRYMQTTLECSPLRCNGLAAEYGANRWCLLDTLEQAIAAVESFERRVAEPEPGPYVVLEVWVERLPTREP